jgi:predicted RNA methylase
VFEAKDVRKLWIDREYGIVITNPPYGIRLAEYQELNSIYIALNKMFRKKDGWSVTCSLPTRSSPTISNAPSPTGCASCITARLRRIFTSITAVSRIDNPAHMQEEA